MDQFPQSAVVTAAAVLLSAGVALPVGDLLAVGVHVRLDPVPHSATEDMRKLIFLFEHALSFLHLLQLPHAQVLHLLTSPHTREILS